jgi:hypothetical protein
MMRLLCEADREALMRYVCVEPAFNLFIIGDVENYGLSGTHVDVAVCTRDDVCTNDEAWDSIVLRYGASFVVYARQEDFDAKSVSQYIASHHFETISGKADIVSRLIPYFPDIAPRMTILSRCDRIEGQAKMPAFAKLRRIRPEESGDIVTLFCRIEEFRSHYVGREELQRSEIATNLATNGMGIGAFVGGELVCYAQTTARNSQSAMVVGVCTLPEYRQRGLASAVMTKLCRESFAQGLSFLCLFYDNPAAGRIYTHIGFAPVGEYMLMEPRDKGIAKTSETR